MDNASKNLLNKKNKKKRKSKSEKEFTNNQHCKISRSLSLSPLEKSNLVNLECIELPNSPYSFSYEWTFNKNGSPKKEVAKPISCFRDLFISLKDLIQAFISAGIDILKEILFYKYS